MAADKHADREPDQKPDARGASASRTNRIEPKRMDAVKPAATPSQRIENRTHGKMDSLRAQVRNAGDQIRSGAISAKDRLSGAGHRVADDAKKLAKKAETGGRIVAATAAVGIGAHGAVWVSEATPRAHSNDSPVTQPAPRGAVDRSRKSPDYSPTTVQAEASPTKDRTPEGQDKREQRQEFVKSLNEFQTALVEDKEKREGGTNS